MKRNYALFGVEGPHDQAFVSRILRKFFEFKKFKGGENDLKGEVWEYFIPPYPSKSGDLYKRLNMPSILENDDISVALWCNEGIDSLKKFLPADLNGWDDFKNLTAFGLFIDSDKKDPADIATRFSKIYQAIFPNFPTEPGLVDTRGSRTGIYVFPDNINNGVLENILIDCGKEIFPNSLELATGLLDNINKTNELTVNDLREYNKPYGREKAIVSSMVSILKPGKTNTVSINDNQWVSERTRSILEDVIRFITEILDLKTD